MARSKCLPCACRDMYEDYIELTRKGIKEKADKIAEDARKYGCGWAFRDQVIRRRNGQRRRK